MNTAFGHRHYLYSAALLIFMRRTTIPNSSFLIQTKFHSQSKGDTPHGLTLNRPPNKKGQALVGLSSIPILLTWKG